MNRKNTKTNIFNLVIIILICCLCFTGCSSIKTNKVNIIQNTYTTETVDKLTTNVVESIEKVEDSVVEIYASNNNSTSCGSGVIINLQNEDKIDNAKKNENEYYVITNFHVIENAFQFYIKLTNSQKTYNTTLIGGDYKSDIAVLLIKTTDLLTTSTFGDSSLLKKGQTCFAIGNPLGQLGGSVSVGNISFLNRQITVEGNVMSLIQTTAAINSGNSGGGLFDELGNLIGVVNAKSSGTGIEGIGFAIPSNDALKCFAQIINSCVMDGGNIISYGYVEGNTNLGLQVKESYGSLYVSSVMQNSDSAKAIGNVSSSLNGTSTSIVTGLVSDDKIISVNGKVISTFNEYYNIVNNLKIGQTLKIVVLRTSAFMFESRNYYITFNITLTQFLYEPPTV